MHLSYLWPPLVSFISTLVLLRGALWLFPRLRLLDRPHEYGLTRKPIPYSAGIVIFIVLIAGCLLFLKLSPLLWGVLAAALLITLTSFIDDRKRLSPILRLGVQILAGLIVVFAGMKLQLISNPLGATPIYLDQYTIKVFGKTIWLMSAALIIFWLVLVTNVMNWLDGIPGLTSGISTIAFISLFILATRQFHIVDQTALITISSILAAATLAFLFFDFYPPKLLMGDTGSMLLGFMLGVLSLLAGGKIATVLLIMGFAIVDAFWVIISRMIKGASPLKGDLSHFHHRLLRVGLTPRKALLFNYFFCALFAAIALFLNSAYTKLVAFLGVIILMVWVGLFLFYKNTKKQQ